MIKLFNSLSKLAEGRGDDLFSAVCLASESDLFVAPAMNQAMWKDMRTQKNLKRIIKSANSNDLKNPCAGSNKLLTDQPTSPHQPR